MLRGSKVLIRAIEKTDIDVVASLSNDFEIHIQADDDVFVPRNREQVEKLMDELGKSEEEIGPFVIEAEGEVIGTCGLHHVDRRSRTCSFGISLGRDHLGKGYGRDAVRTLVGYAFRHLNMRKLWLSVYADNERAIRSYKSVGFREEAVLKEHVYSEGVHKDWLYMSLFRRDYEPLSGGRISSSE